MTVVEKAAYLKGLCEGLGVEPGTKEGRLWSALCDLVSDMAHEIEDLQQSDTDFADALNEIGNELSYLEELTCDLDVPEDMMDEECSGDCASCAGKCGEYDGFDADSEFGEDEEDDEDFDGEELPDGEEFGEPIFDEIVYDVVCPNCGEEISFGQDTLDSGSTTCPSCGEVLEFDLSDEFDEEDEDL